MITVRGRMLLKVQSTLHKHEVVTGVRNAKHKIQTPGQNMGCPQKHFVAGRQMIDPMR